jgi:hypothetical protein
MDKLEELQEIEYEYRKLEEAEKNRIKNFGIEAYIPNPMQLKAHKSLARLILYVGGNRAGKSTFGAVELCFHLTRDYPEWYPMDRRFHGPIKACVSSTQYSIVGRVIEPKIFSLLPKGYYTFKRSNQGYLAKITCKDGSTVDILTSEMKNDAYESADWDFAWCDEPQDQFKYQALRRGLVDRQGTMLITFTPLTEPWMKEELVDKADGKLIDVITVNIRDNLVDIHGNKILSEQAIQEFEDSLPEDVKESRISGKFFHLRGAVYKEFSDEHVKEVYYDKEKQFPVIAVLDPHDRQPHHIIWAWIDPDDDVTVDFEMTIHCELPDLAKKILLVEKERGYNMKRRLIDPNFGRKPSKSGGNASVIDELYASRVAFYEANDNVELGHMLIREALHYNNKKPVTVVNKPKLFFSRFGCPITIRSVRNLQYEEWKGNTKNEKNPKESQKQKDDHGADCTRYLIISKPSYKGLSQRGRSQELSEPVY